ncbi:unnamed protein product, partial [Mesorhabditis spiculigera]
MPKYRVTETITLYGGELILTDAQASARKHCLEPFKVGEVIVIPGEPDKALDQRLVKVDKAGGTGDAE